jgi:hypothetical protein
MKQAIAPRKLGNARCLCPYLTDKLWISQLNYFMSRQSCCKLQIVVPAGSEGLESPVSPIKLLTQSQEKVYKHSTEDLQHVHSKHEKDFMC